MADLHVWVGGIPLALICRYGDVEMSTVWPGGSDELSWAYGDGQTAPRFPGNTPVIATLGGARVWAGNTLEPDPGQDRTVAQGAWRQGEKFPALTSSGLAATGPDQSIDNAITLRGLTWTRPASIFSSAVSIDISQGPVTLGGLLDTYCENTGNRWGVNPYREVYAKADDTTPTYQTLPLDGGLGYALDNYASTLFCRYLDSTTSTYKTVTVSDTAAQALHGYQEAILDLTDRGAISAATATSIGNQALTLGKSTPQWTQSIEFSYGEILTMGGGSIALETVAAGKVLRVHGGWELASRQNGAMYVDVLIGQTSLSGGTLTLQPLLKASRSFTDVLTDALNKKK